jgi:hypothetical protein
VLWDRKRTLPRPNPIEEGTLEYKEATTLVDRADPDTGLIRRPTTVLKAMMETKENEMQS